MLRCSGVNRQLPRVDLKTLMCVWSAGRSTGELFDKEVISCLERWESFKTKKSALPPLFSILSSQQQEQRSEGRSKGNVAVTKRRTYPPPLGFPISLSLSKTMNHSLTRIGVYMNFQFRRESQEPCAQLAFWPHALPVGGIFWNVLIPGLLVICRNYLRAHLNYIFLLVLPIHRVWPNA